MGESVALAKRESGYSGGINELVEIASQTEAIKELGKTLIDSGLLPDAIKKPESAVAVMIKGAELGMSAMYALSHIAVINGKPAMSAEAMLALVQRAGHRIRIVETTSEKCAVVGIRREDPKHPTRIEWTMEDAKRAQLAGKGPWKTYPRAMLRARAISELCRAAFADVLSGVSFVPEELGASVNEDGEIIDVEPRAQVHSEIEAKPEDEGNSGGQSQIREGQANRLRKAINDAGRDEHKFEEKIGPIGELSEAEFSKWIGKLEREIASSGPTEAEYTDEAEDDAYELSEEDAREIEEIPS